MKDGIMNGEELEAALKSYNINKEIEELATLYDVKEYSIWDFIETMMEESKYTPKVLNKREAWDKFKNSDDLDLFIENIKFTERMNKNFQEQIEEFDKSMADYRQNIKNKRRSKNE